MHMAIERDRRVDALERASFPPANEGYVVQVLRCCLLERRVTPC